jgi:hypothetical protein
MSRLDEPGKPLGDLQQTRRDNCAEAVRFAGGPDKVTDELLASSDLTREDFKEFLMDLAAARRDQRKATEQEELWLRGLGVLPEDPSRAEG